MVNLPKTLLVRSFLLMVVLIILSQAASVAIFRHAEEEPRTQQLAQLVVSVVNLTRAAVLSSAPEWRGALLAELDAAEDLQVQMADEKDVIKPILKNSSHLQLMMDKVRESLGEETRFAEEINHVPALWVSFFIGDEEFWIALPKARVEHPVSQVLLAGGGIILILSLIGAYLIAKQVTFPLLRLAKAAQQVGQGVTPEVMPEGGAHEIAVVSRAFNQMSTDLSVNERERALVLAGISHDLRTPLARVQLAAELSSDDALREGLTADVEQMDQVLQQFLDYSRHDGNEAEIKTDVVVLVKNIAQRYEGRTNSLVLELRPIEPLIIRPLLFERALVNLLENAIKYGGGHVTLRLQQGLEYVELSVEDQGVGIPESERETVKRPFVRLDHARTNTPGSGLGLAIVDRAARLHRGQFRLAENEAGGLVARLLFPVSA